VLERDGAVYRVATDAGEVRAVLRGKAKRETPKVVVGDVVALEA
jgi:translation initiation factor IF-1